MGLLIYFYDFIAASYFTIYEIFGNSTKTKIPAKNPSVWHLILEESYHILSPGSNRKMLNQKVQGWSQLGYLNKFNKISHVIHIQQSISIILNKHLE